MLKSRLFVLFFKMDIVCQHANEIQKEQRNERMEKNKRLAKNKITFKNFVYIK